MTPKELKEQSCWATLKQILKDDRICLDARALWLTLQTYEGSDGLICPSIPSLAKRTGHSEAWVKRYIKELNEKGFISIQKGSCKKGWYNIYNLLIPK